VFAGHLAINTKNISQGSKQRLTCALAGETDCWKVGFHINRAFLVLLLSSTCVACFCCMVLSFHSRTIERWMSWFPCLRNIKACSVLKRWTEEVNASRLEKSTQSDKGNETTIDKSEKSEKSEKSGDVDKSIDKSKSGNTSPVPRGTATNTNGDTNRLKIDRGLAQNISVELTVTETVPTKE